MAMSACHEPVNRRYIYPDDVRMFFLLFPISGPVANMMLREILISWHMNFHPSAEFLDKPTFKIYSLPC